jgi:hypothetical protein
MMAAACIFAVLIVGAPIAVIVLLMLPRQERLRWPCR